MRVVAVAAVALGAAATGALAQGAALRGSVADSATREPLASVRVEATGAGMARMADTDSRGRFAITNLAPGSYTLRLRRVGYASRTFPVQHGGDGPELDVTMAAIGVPLDPVVVTASRTEQAALDAPVAVSVVSRQAIEERPSFVPADYVQDVPGVDFARKGLTQSVITYRGQRGASSGAVLMMSDWRFAGIPSIGFNIPYLISATNEDVARIEVQRGAAAALYGPGAPRGVLHVITRSPFESRGGVVSVTAGERNVLGTTVRYAAQLSSRLAFKISGEYLRGDDWPHVDSIEVRNRNRALALGARADTLRIGRRDPRLERMGGDARLDWRPGGETEVIASYGFANAIRNTELAPAVGSVQGDEWVYSYWQLRVNRRQLLANLVYNRSDAGGTYLLRTGNTLFDDTRLIIAQLQHGMRTGSVDLLYGTDLRLTDPRTNGTIHGSNEDKDKLTEVGGYVHASAALSPRFDLVAALRADRHSRLDDFVFSPRAGLVFKPTRTQSLRVTYNRAFTSPPAQELFLDIINTTNILPPGMPGNANYDVRAAAVPRNGYTFRRDCGTVNGGLCMRSPFPSAAGTDFAAADATRFWASVVGILAASGINIAAVPVPNSTQVRTNLAGLNPVTGAFNAPLHDSLVRDFIGQNRGIVNTVELGWKGLIGSRHTFAIDVWHTRTTNVSGIQRAATPSVFMDSVTLRTYLTPFVGGANAAAIARTIGAIPFGTISPVESPDPTDIVMVTPPGSGSFNMTGVDVAGDFRLTDQVTLSASYSWVSDDSIPNVVESGTPLLGTYYFNTPRTKGSLAVSYDDPQRGIAWSVRGRAVSSFPIVSGVYRGTVDSYAVLDASLNFRIPGMQRLHLGVTGQNLLNITWPSANLGGGWTNTGRHREYIGAPAIGRLVMARLRVEF